MKNQKMINRFVAISDKIAITAIKTSLVIFAIHFLKMVCLYS